MRSGARVRRYGPLAFFCLALLAALTVGAVALAQGLSRTPEGRPRPSVLRWGNEKITDLYTLDPARGPDFNSRLALQLIFGGLVRFGPGSRILPDTAARWHVSPDGRIYTFYLRPHVRFADGTPLTAADVVYSLTRILSPALAARSGAGLLSDIVGARAMTAGKATRVMGIQALNARTVRIRLIQPDGSFLDKLANPIGYIVPPWRVRADPQHWDQTAFGAGPFRVSRWIHNRALLLIPNSHYYAGRLKITGINMPFIPEPLSAYKRYLAGNIDTMGSVQFPSEALYDVRGRRYFHESPRLETLYLTLNERKAPFNDARVRLAFAHALDKKALVRTVWGGFAHATNGLLPPGLPGYNPRLKGAGYNPSLARRLLGAAGYPHGRGLPAVEYPVDQDAFSVILANALAHQWRRILGVRVRIVQYTHSEYVSVLTRLDYTIGVIDWTDDYPDPENFLSQQLHSGNPNNNGGWSNRTFDRLVDRADRMPSTSPARFALYQRAEEIAMNRAAVIPLVNPEAGILLRPTVRGIQISNGYLVVPDWTQVRLTSGTTR